MPVLLATTSLAALLLAAPAKAGHRHDLGLDSGDRFDA
jgi:hypothetical protein